MPWQNLFLVWHHAPAMRVPILISILLSSENDITDVLDLTFSTDDDRFGEVVTVDLIPNGQNIDVTEENKKEYVK
jgi:HECT-domain (ubiquitin-transferase)